MSNVIKFLKRDIYSAFSSYFKYTLLILIVFAIALFVRTGDMLYLSILLLSYICTFFWVGSDRDARSVNFLNFLAAPADSYVTAKFIFLVISIIPFTALSLVETIIFMEFMKFELTQVICLNACTVASCLLFGGLSFAGVFTFGVERFKWLYGAPVFIGVLLSFFAVGNPILMSVINFFLSSIVASVIFLVLSIAVYFVCWIISKRNFSFRLLFPTNLPTPPAR